MALFGLFGKKSTAVPQPSTVEPVVPPPVDASAPVSTDPAGVPTDAVTPPTVSVTPPETTSVASDPNSVAPASEDATSTDGVTPPPVV